MPLNSDRLPAHIAKMTYGGTQVVVAIEVFHHAAVADNIGQLIHHGFRPHVLSLDVGPDKLLKGFRVQAPDRVRPRKVWGKAEILVVALDPAQRMPDDRDAGVRGAVLHNVHRVVLVRLEVCGVWGEGPLNRDCGRLRDSHERHVGQVKRPCAKAGTSGQVISVGKPGWSVMSNSARR